ncbi:MAG: xanthine dehydrogenase family protein subunit M, partial [Actinobacteria bacterium]|nr:xanthine dehydrogenase family protein subunit M [Actinomycetota bacterium]
MEVREFYQPRSVQEALELLGRAPGETRVVAGGTDLFLQLRRGDIRAAYLLDVGGVAELAYIREEPQFIRVGAATLVDDLARSGLLRRYAPALAEAASALGSPQIRNRATIGGNLGRSSPAADCVCALMALGAEVLVQSASGTREIPIDRFLLGPGKNALAPDELIVEVRLGKPRGRFGSRFLKLGRRKALVLATASAAAHVELDGAGAIGKCGLAMGAVGPVTVRAQSAEELLRGKALSPEAIRAAAGEASRQASPISDVRGSAEYRRTVIPVLVGRVLEDAWARAQEA